MGYRKVYLTLEEEDDIARIKASRASEGRPGAAFNAILKEGLALVLDQELTRGSKGQVVATTEKVVETTESSPNRGRRRRRNG